MSARLVAFLGAVLTAAACAERVAAPGTCPDYCPRAQITTSDTLLRTNISKDSAYRGYVLANQAAVMLAADSPVDSRAIFRFSAYGPRFRIDTSAADTTMGAILSTDSARLRLYITRRDTATHNLTLRLYRLPVTIDTTTTFAALAPPFTDSLLRAVNIDSLLAKRNHKDTTTGDSIAVDTLRRVFVSLRLDSAQARYVAADTGRVAYGIRVSASAAASIALGKGDLAPLLQPYVKVDSLGTPVRRTPLARGTPLTTFVFNPPAPPLDATLAVGGVPSARSILRVTFPRGIRDSAQIVRGTLLLVPAVAARGAPADSFVIEAHTALADFGAKSPIAFDLTRTDTTVIHVGATDTARIEITNLLQFWQSDTSQPTSIVLTAKYEAQDLAEIRFYPSVAIAYRPAIRITFAPRFPFGKP